MENPQVKKEKKAKVKLKPKAPKPKRAKVRVKMKKPKAESTPEPKRAKVRVTMKKPKAAPSKPKVKIKLKSKPKAPAKTTINIGDRTKTPEQMGVKSKKAPIKIGDRTKTPAQMGVKAKPAEGLRAEKRQAPKSRASRVKGDLKRLGKAVSRKAKGGAAKGGVVGTALAIGTSLYDFSQDNKKRNKAASDKAVAAYKAARNGDKSKLSPAQLKDFERKYGKGGSKPKAAPKAAPAPAKKAPAKKAPAKKSTSKFGSGSSQTVTHRGRKMANVSREQLKSSGLSLRAYMNKWKKTGKRP